MRHIFPPSSHKDVLLILAVAILIIGVVCCAIVAVVSAIRKRGGIPMAATELSTDDLRFLDRFHASRIVVMSIVYSIALAIVFSLMWLLAGKHAW